MNVLAKKNGISYAGEYVSSNVYDISVNEPGTYEIWANVDGGASKKVSSVVVSGLEEYNIDVVVISTDLDKNSWQLISDTIKDGQASNYWNIGDMKEVILDGKVQEVTFTNQSIYAVIVGIDHNQDLESPNEHRVHFQLGKINKTDTYISAFVDDLYGEEQSEDKGFVFNGYNATKGANQWPNSTIRAYCGRDDSYKTNTFLNCFSDELKAQVKTIIKYTIAGTYGTPSSFKTPVQTTEKVFILSQWEIAGVQGNATNYDNLNNVQYSYYKIGNEQRKSSYKDTKTLVRSWLRSQPASGGNAGMLTKNNTGSDNKNVLYSYAVSPCFCV